jgi:GT2 family glycosyltransferase
MRCEISIVIVSYNVCELLRNCLNSIAEQDVATEIIVVDNASSDQTVQMVTHEFALVNLIANNSNVGFSAANNQGMDASSGPLILLLNPDTELSIGSLRKMVDFAKAQPGHSLIGPQLLNSDGSLQRSAWRSPSPMDMILEAMFLRGVFGWSDYPKEEFRKQFEPGMLSGAALLFTRELYLRIGGLDPKLFWMEDADFSTRVREAGGKVIYFPDVQVTHHSGQSAKKNLTVVVSNQLLSKLKFYRKHFGWFAAFMAGWFCFFHIITRIIIFGLLSVAGKRFSSKAAAYCGALPRFFAYVFANDQKVT